MFIKQLDMTEFRGVKRCDKPLELSKFTVLVGRNNSGKSSILEAIYILVSSPNYQNRAYNFNTIELLRLLHSGSKSLVYGYSGTAVVEYIIDESKVKVETDGNNVKMFMNGGSIDFDRYISHFGLHRDQEYPDTVLFLIPSDTDFMKKLSGTIIAEDRWNAVTKNGANVRVAETIKKCVNDRFTELLISRKELCLRKEISGKFSYIKIDDVGNGLRRAIPVMLQLEAFQPSVVLWDDFEAAAHPSLIKQLITWLNEKPWQVVISTHSIDVLSQLLEVKPEDAKVIMLDKNADDVLFHDSLNMDELESIMKDAGWDPRVVTELVEWKGRIKDMEGKGRVKDEGGSRADRG